MTRKVWRYGLAVWAIMMMVVGTAAAQDVESSGLFGADLLHGLVAAVVYSVLGFIVLMLGFKVFDIVTPFDLNKEIAEDDNPAAGIMVAGMMIALGIIVAAAIS